MSSDVLPFVLFQLHYLLALPAWMAILVFDLSHLLLAIASLLLLLRHSQHASIHSISYHAKLICVLIEEKV